MTRSIFGWSYPPGAANDPFAPYNQDYDDEHCLYCGADLDNTWPAENDADEEALDEGWCNVACKEAYEKNGDHPSDNWGKPHPTEAQLETIKQIHNHIHEWSKTHVRKDITHEELIAHLPEEDFNWDGSDTFTFGDAHVYCCGEKDCPVQWHLAYYTTSAKRVDGNLTIEIHSGDEDGNWDIDSIWEDGDDIEEISYHFGEEPLNEYFRGWAEYWVDAATSGEDPCGQLTETPKDWVKSCLRHALDNIKYLKLDA